MVGTWYTYLNTMIINRYIIIKLKWNTFIYQLQWHTHVSFTGCTQNLLHNKFLVIPDFFYNYWLMRSLNHSEPIIVTFRYKIENLNLFSWNYTYIKLQTLITRKISLNSAIQISDFKNVMKQFSRKYYQ